MHGDITYNLTLKSDSHVPKKLFYLLQWNHFKNDEKCFLFHFTSYLRSQDISTLVLTFWSCAKVAWLERKG